MKGLFSCLILVIFASSVFAFESDLGAIYRVKDVGSEVHEGLNLGHCTAFVHPQENSLMSAGHCFHRKGFVIVDEKGGELLSLGLDKASMARSSYGLLDMSSFELTSGEAKKLRKSFNDILPQNQKGYLILGYPASRRSHQLTEIRCTEFEVRTLREKIESELGIINLNCDAFDERGMSIGELSHDLVKGASGSPAYLDGKVIGVAFNYNYESDIESNVLKVIKLSAVSRMLPYKRAWQNYSLDRKSFEQVKLPNKVKSDFDVSLVIYGKLKTETLNRFQSINTVSDDAWTLRRHDGSSLSIAPSIFSGSLKEILKSVSH